MAFFASRLGVALRYIQTIGVTDIIDMAIIAYILYRLFRFARKAQAGQVLKGIVIVVAALWLSYELKLHVMYFILRSAVEIGFLALIVVFQPEIRHFLEQIGSKGFRRFLSPQAKMGDVESAIRQTVDAFGSMSRDHIGALVVFERVTILDECVKSGTEVDAEVSSELLKNIFWPKAPLHDGAVIIRNGRVLSAGCVLPLTGNLNVSRDLGTRHRAGIGVSEQSDAVVAIVSEETGAISVAVGGMLKRHLTVDTLERLLRNELLSNEETEDKKHSLADIFRRKKEGDDHVE